MRIKIAVDADGSGFASLAAKIASPDPVPGWLAPGLAHFASFIGNGITGNPSQKGEAAMLEGILTWLCDASETLLRHLPLFRELPLGMRSPDDVEVVLALLPGIKADLESGVHPSGWTPLGGQNCTPNNRVGAEVEGCGG